MWVIQDKVFGDEQGFLVDALKSAKIPYSIGYPSSISNSTVIRGTIDFVNDVQSLINKVCNTCTKYTKLTLENYDCHRYYSYFGVRMLNNDYILLPWSDLSMQKDLIFKTFDTERLFIRPNSGKKIFTGTTVSKKWFDKELEIIKNLPGNTIKNDDLILISSYKKIISEFRLLLHKDVLIDYCRYSEEYNIFDDVIIKFFAKSNSYFPDEYFTMDIAKTESSYKIIELNSFCSAGLYDMDYAKIVKNVK